MDLTESAGAVLDRGAVHDFLNTRCLTIAGGTEQILLTMAGERLLGLHAEPPGLPQENRAYSS